MILISILAHENLAVLLDQVANFKKFAPRAFVFIHLARQMVETSPEALEVLRQLDGVWVNPDPLYTGFGMVLKCHVSNFLYAEKAGIDFTHFTMHASNDLFVRAGVEDYVLRHDYAFFKADLATTRLGFAHWQANCRHDPIYRRMMRGIDSIPARYASQVEGTFYPRAAFREFAELFARRAWREIPWPCSYVHGRILKLVELTNHVQLKPKRRKYLGQFAYPKEEFYLPNFFANKCAHPAAPYCFMNWGKSLQVTKLDIETIRAGAVPEGEYDQCEYDELFAVKRIDRKIDDPLRKLIGTLT